MAVKATLEPIVRWVVAGLGNIGLAGGEGDGDRIFAHLVEILRSDE